MDDLLFDSDDLGATEDFLVRAYTKMRIGAEGPRPRARIARRWLGSISLDNLSFDYTLSYDAKPLERICICRVHSGHIDEDFVGEPQDIFAPGDVTLYTPPELPYSGRVRGARYDLTMFDPALLDRVAATAPNRRGESVRLTGHRPVSAAAGQQLSRYIKYLGDLVGSGTEAKQAPLLAATASWHLAATVLQAFPNNALTDPTPTDRQDGKPILLRRAMSYIEANGHTDIALADIAAHVYVTPRAVQYMFRRHLDCTPMEYIRRVRLDHAHRELVEADPSGTTVARIANKWGFAHSGRFAVYYRAMYGCSPNDTLRN